MQTAREQDLARVGVMVRPHHGAPGLAHPCPRWPYDSPAETRRVEMLCIRQPGVSSSLGRECGRASGRAGESGTVGMVGVVGRLA